MAAKRGGLLFAPQKKRHPGRLVALLLFLLTAGIVLGLNAVNNSQISLQKLQVSIAGMNQRYEGFTILHISDLHGRHFGEGQERLYQQIRLERYHAVCLTGDMTGKDGDYSALLELLDRMPSDVPVFLIPGDEDPEALNGRVPQRGVKADFITLAEEKGAIYLDSPQKVTFQGQTLWFSPASLYMTDLQAADFSLKARREELEAMRLAGFIGPEDEAALRAVDYQLKALERTQAARQEMKPDDVYVLMSHLPLNSEDVAGMQEGDRLERHAINFPGRISLILSGHWNNGQWRLPLLGPVYMPLSSRGLSDWMPAGGEAAGLAMVHGVPQYISPGLGASSVYPWWMPMRLFNRPQITLLTLTNRLI